MGLTMLEIRVGNPATPEVTEQVELLVDSGARYSLVPTSARNARDQADERTRISSSERRKDDA